MINDQNSKHFDLEERTFQYAKRCRAFTQKLPKTQENFNDSDQLIRASGSVGANYIEANEALSKKDFFLRMKICRKEAKESKYWLRLVNTKNLPELEKEREELINEATELTKIFGSIIEKSK